LLRTDVQRHPSRTGLTDRGCWGNRGAGRGEWGRFRLVIEIIAADFDGGIHLKLGIATNNENPKASADHHSKMVKVPRVLMCFLVITLGTFATLG